MTIVRIPSEFAAALEERPEEFTLRLVLADWFEEHDDLVSADCMRWSVATKQVPSLQGEKRNIMRFDSRDVPRLLYRLLASVPGARDSVTFAFERLLTGWHNSSPEERQWYWLWRTHRSEPTLFY